MKIPDSIVPILAKKFEVWDGIDPEDFILLRGLLWDDEALRKYLDRHKIGTAKIEVEYTDPLDPLNGLE